jgi:hypothetical protein
MASGYGNGSHFPSADQYQAGPAPGSDDPYAGDGGWHNGDHQGPTRHDMPPPSNPNLGPDPNAYNREREVEDRPPPDRAHTPRSKGSRSASSPRMCKKCGLQLTGQFVRALDGTFHLDCFRCRVSWFDPDVPGSLIISMVAAGGLAC